MDLIQADPLADDDTGRRRAAIAELGSALRDLVQTAVATEVDTAELFAAAQAVRSITQPLTTSLRRREQFARADDIRQGVRLYNPVIGAGSPFAPPLTVVRRADGHTEGTCTLGLAYEGPPMFAHGGVSAMLLDQLLGHTIALGGRPGMTRDLAVRYRRPVPLQTPLFLTGRLVETDDEGRRIIATATLATADDPSTVLVEATGTFVALHPDLAARIFADLDRTTRP